MENRYKEGKIEAYNEILNKFIERSSVEKGGMEELKESIYDKAEKGTSSLKNTMESVEVQVKNKEELAESVKSGGSSIKSLMSEIWENMSNSQIEMERVKNFEIITEI